MESVGSKRKFETEASSSVSKVSRHDDPTYVALKSQLYVTDMPDIRSVAGVMFGNQQRLYCWTVRTQLGKQVKRQRNAMAPFVSQRGSTVQTLRVAFLQHAVFFKIDFGEALRLLQEHGARTAARLVEEKKEKSIVRALGVSGRWKEVFPLHTAVSFSAKSGTEPKQVVGGYTKRGCNQGLPMLIDVAPPDEDNSDEDDDGVDETDPYAIQMQVKKALVAVENQLRNVPCLTWVSYFEFPMSIPLKTLLGMHKELEAYEQSCKAAETWVAPRVPVDVWLVVLVFVGKRPMF